MNAELKQQIVILSRQGLTERKIVLALDIPKTSVHRVLATLQAMETNAVLGDLHMRFQDNTAIRLTLRVLDKIQPERITILGDLLDMYDASVFAKEADIDTLAQEIEIGAQFLSHLHTRYPTADIDWVFGNHEYRFDRYIKLNARALLGLPGLTLEAMVRQQCTRGHGRWLSVHYSGLKESYVPYGKLLLGHWDKVMANSGYTAKNLLRDVSLIQAHTHRLGSHYRNGHKRQLAAWENGCLCDINPSYVLNPNWQQGFSIVYRDLLTEAFFVDQVAIQQIGENYMSVVNGTMYVEIKNDEPVW